MAGLLKDMKGLLTGESYIYIGDMPDTPDVAVALYNTGGYDSVHTLGAQAPSHEEPTFQIVLRDSSYSNMVSRAEAIKGLLDGKCDFTVGSNKYISIFMQGDINPLGRDQRNRIKVTLNFKVKVKRG